MNTARNTNIAPTLNTALPRSTWLPAWLAAAAVSWCGLAAAQDAPTAPVTGPARGAAKAAARSTAQSDAGEPRADVSPAASGGTVAPRAPGAALGAAAPGAAAPGAAAPSAPTPGAATPGAATSGVATPGVATPTAGGAPAPRRTPPAGPKAPGAPGVATPGAADRVALGTATVTGDREQPKVMYIVPWKQSDIGDLSGKPMNSLVDEALAPIDRDEFKREVAYFDALKGEPSQHGAANAAAQGEK